MKGRLRKSEGNWVVDYVVDSENPNAVFTAKTIALHPDDVKQIEEDSKVFDNIEARIANYPDVDFEISVCIPSNLEPTRGETVSFDAIKYAKLTPFEHGLSKETLDELFEAHEPEDFINEKDEELLIELEEWDHTCNDGCCYTYGVNIYINGEQIEDEDGTSHSQLLTAVLNKLGYTNVKVEYK